MKKILYLVSCVLTATGWTAAFAQQQVNIYYRIGKTGDDELKSSNAWIKDLGSKTYVTLMNSGESAECHASPLDGTKMSDWGYGQGDTLIAARNASPTWIGSTSESYTWTYQSGAKANVVVRAVFDYIAYNVEYKSNKGTAPSAETRFYNATEELASVTGIPAGYEFVQWDATSDDVTLPKSSFAAQEKVSGESFGLQSYHQDGAVITLNARFNPKAYSITSSGENCTVTVAQKATYTDDVTISWTPMTAAVGHAVSCKSVKVCDDAGEVIRDFGTPAGTSVTFKMSSENQYWSAIVVKVVYEDVVNHYSLNVTSAGNGSVAKNPNQTDYAYGSSVTLTATPYDGYAFEKWDDGNVQNSRSVTVTGAKTYTATFTNALYTIKFHPNGGMGTMENVVATCHVAQTLPKCKFTNGSYPFKGWNTRQDGKGTSYLDEGSITQSAAADLTLYAQWDTTGYSLYVYLDGGIYDGDQQSVTFKELYPLIPNAIDLNQIGVSRNPNGAPFKGYYSGKDGSGAQVYDERGHWVGGNAYWTDDGKYKGSGNLSVYAFWGPVPKNLEVAFAAEPSEAGDIRVDYDGRTVTSNDFTLTVIEGSNFVMTASVTNSGYSFSCWTNSLGFTTNDNPWTYAAPSVVTNVALFTGNVYKVTFDGQRWYRDTQTKYVTYGDVYGDPETPMTMEGFKLEGWYTSPDPEDKDRRRYDATNKVEIANDHRLYANWIELGTYTIHYVGNGAISGSMDDQTPYCETPTALTANAFAMKGYTFANWTNEAGRIFADGATVTDLAPAGGTATLYAVWSNNVYTVDFDANGGTGSMDPQQFTYDVPKALPECAYKNGSMVFAGWSNDVEKVIYMGGQEVTNLCTGAVGDDKFRLYAVWKPEDLGKYSPAMHCTNLKWVTEDNQGEFDWDVNNVNSAGVNNDGTGPSGSEVVGTIPSNDSESETKPLTATLSSGGRLSFRYWMSRASDGEDLPALELRGVEGDPWYQETPPSEGEDPYAHYGSGEVIVPEGVIEISFVLRGKPGDYVCLDQVTWTPDSPDPQQGEPVSVTGAAVEGGTFKLTVLGEAGITYGVWTNVDLTVPVADWGLMETKEGEGVPLEFSVPILPGMPKLFFSPCKVK